MPKIRLCIIGGGSPYMTSMFSSLARYARKGDLAGSEIILHDIDEKSVKLMCDWGNAGARNDNVPLAFRCEGKLEKALDGADFVLSCIRPGGLDARSYDESIPIRHGELGNETVGVGGVFYALRCIPVVKTIAETIRKCCPNAWLINYTNPTSMASDVSLRVGHTRTLGLCDGVWGIKWLAAKLLKIGAERAHEIEPYVSGINHFTWTLQLYHQGRDLYREMDQLIDNTDLSGKAGYETIDESEGLNEVEADVCRLYRYYGILPGTIYYTRNYYNVKKLLRYHMDPKWEFRSLWLKGVKAEKRAEIARQLSSGEATIVPKDIEDAAHGDQAIGVLNAIANDTRMMEAVNVVNNGAVSFLPDHAVVEMTCIVGAAGALPCVSGTIPYALQGMIRDAYDSTKLSVDAALSGDRKLVLQAAMAHPAHRDLDVIEKVIAELFEAHKGLMPNFQ